MINIQYEFIKVLGKGGSCQVNLVKNRRINRLYAEKKYCKEGVGKECFKKELTILQSIECLGIPNIIDTYEDDSYYYLYEEYISGKTYGEYLEDLEDLEVLEDLEGLEVLKNNGDIEASELCTYSKKYMDILSYIVGICNILAKLHFHNPVIIHGDIKPDNIIINKNGAYLLDYGNSIFVDNKDNIEGGIAKNNKNSMLTVNYAAPEQFTGCPLDDRCDIYSIGVLLKYTYDRRPELFINIKDELLGIVNRCLEPKENNRFGNILEVKNCINRLLYNGDSYNNFNEKDNKGKTINIYVYGARRYVGVTHLSIGLINYLKHSKCNITYIENNKKKMTLNLNRFERNYKYGDSSFQYNGLRYLWNYNGFLDSSEGINKKAVTCINIVDSGCLGDEELPKDGFVIVVITSTSEFRYDYEDEKSQEKILNKYKNNNNILYVVNFSDKDGLKEICKKYGLIPLKMPLFDSISKADRKTNEFFRQIINRTINKSKKNFK